MRGGKIEYGLLVETALRQVVREVLGRLVRDEIPEPHHFYITYRTTHSGVGMPDYLRERYPSDMTIVLQHQYWDLEVGDTGFSVVLSFNDVLERLVVPYEAIKVFADPGVEFGLQFTIDVEEGVSSVEQPTPLKAKPRLRPAGEAEDTTPATLPIAPAGAPAGSNKAPEPASDDKPATAEIVALDRFRKK